MKMRSGALPRAAGMRVFLGLALTFSVLLARPRIALATKAEEVTLDEDSSAAAPKSDAKGEQESGGEPRVKRVVPPYSLPWQLRPVLPMNMVRSDTSFAFYGVDGASIVSFLSGSYKVIPRLAIFAKLGVAEDSPPTGVGGFSVANPLLGAHLGLWPAKALKLGLSLGLTVPIGSGGSNSTDAGAQETNYAAMLARSGFDNALFMPDYFSILPGVDLALVTHNLTLQAEVNVVFLTKVRGQQQEKSATDDLSFGLHAGYFFFPFLSAGVDLRYQFWIGKPSFVIADPSGASRDNATIALGPRFHVQLSEELWIRPGLSMSFGLDNPISGSHYKTVQLDVPFFF